MEAGNEFALSLGQIERRPFTAGKRTRVIEAEGSEGERIVEYVPIPNPALIESELRQIHAAGRDDGDEDAERHRDFVADHLGRFAHAAEQSPFTSRAVADE